MLPVKPHLAGYIGSLLNVLQTPQTNMSQHTPICALLNVTTMKVIAHLPSGGQIIDFTAIIACAQITDAVTAMLAASKDTNRCLQSGSYT
jgi:hypothetical protein